MISLNRGANKWKASLVSLALVIGVRSRNVHGEVGKFDALCDYSDVSWGCTDPSSEVLVLLLWPASKRPDGFEDRGFNARVCEIVHRPIRVLKDVVENCGAQLEHRRIRTDCLRDVECVRQVELARLVSAMVLSRIGPNFGGMSGWA